MKYVCRGKKVEESEGGREGGGEREGGGGREGRRRGEGGEEGRRGGGLLRLRCEVLGVRGLRLRRPRFRFCVQRSAAPLQLQQSNRGRGRCIRSVSCRVVSCRLRPDTQFNLHIYRWMDNIIQYNTAIYLPAGYPAGLRQLSPA